LLNEDEDKNRNKDCQYLANGLFNNTKILNATSYLQDIEELNEHRSKFYFFINIKI